jgi:hypothetical protein
MFLLARRFVNPQSFTGRDAIFAAVLYAVNPYHLVIVYWRSAFAELLASCLVPLLLLCVLKAADEAWQGLAPLALVLAAAWLTNAPAAVMIHYSLALLVVLFAWQRRSVRILLVGAGAVALGACLAAFYLLPATFEQRWIDIAQAVGEGSRPAESFLFSHTADAEHDAFNRIMSWVAVLEMVVVFGAAWGARQLRETRRELWNVLLAWAIACSVLMIPLAGLLWHVLPKIEYMQFPWRWSLCLSMIFCFFVAAAFLKSDSVKSGSRWWWRGGICVAILVVLLAAGYRYQAPWWDNASDLREMQDNMEAGMGYEGVEEYTPAGADATGMAALNKDARNVSVAGPARAAIHVYRWEPESRMFTAEMSAADQLALRLLQYPAWRVEVNGRVVETAARAETAQMLVPVGAGMNRVEIRFVRTWDRTVGGWISIVAVVGVGAWFLRVRRRGSRAIA